MCDPRTLKGPMREAGSPGTPEFGGWSKDSVVGGAS